MNWVHLLSKYKAGYAINYSLLTSDDSSRYVFIEDDLLCAE